MFSKKICTPVLDQVTVLRLTQHKIGHFGDVLPSQSLGTVLKNLNQTQQKQTIQEQTTKTQNAKPKKRPKNKPKPARIFMNCSYVCAYNCTQLSYTTQHRTVLMIFPRILQTIIIAQMISIGGKGN